MSRFFFSFFSNYNLPYYVVVDDDVDLSAKIARSYQKKFLVFLTKFSGVLIQC